MLNRNKDININLILKIEGGKKLMKKGVLILILICILIFFGLSGCIEESIIEGTGTVKYINIEGGFYGILSDTSFFGFKSLDPVNLPIDFKEDGLQVKFKAIILWNQMSFHMWGIMIKIIEIENLDQW
jgi:hypothetical protein